MKCSCSRENRPFTHHERTEHVCIYEVKLNSLHITHIVSVGLHEDHSICSTEVESKELLILWCLEKSYRYISGPSFLWNACSSVLRATSERPKRLRSFLHSNTPKKKLWTRVRRNATLLPHIWQQDQSMTSTGSPSSIMCVMRLNMCSKTTYLYSTLMEHTKSKCIFCYESI